MADVFTVDNTAARAQRPNLIGNYTPGLDQTQLDGLKIMVPWGAGDNQKRFLTGIDSLYTPDAEGSGSLYGNITLADIIQLNQQGLIGQDGKDGTDGKDGLSAEGRLKKVTQLSEQYAAMGGFQLGLPGPAGAAGASGDPAKYIQIEADAFVFLTPSGSPVTPANINLSVQLFNIASPSYQWQYWNGASWTDIGGATSSTYIVNNADFTDERTYQLKVTKDAVDYYDRVTLIHIADGTDGTNGTDGTGFQVYLDNESHTVACNYSGTAKSGELGEGNAATCNVYAFENTTPLTAVSGTPGAGEFKMTLTPTNCTVGQPTADYDTFYIATIMSDTASVLVSINIENTMTVQKVMTLSKAYDGQTLTADFPLPNGLTWTDENPTSSDVSWSSFIMLYGGAEYSVSSGYTSNKYIYWDQSVGTTLSTTNTFSNAVGTNKWLLAENSGGTTYETAATKYLMAGFIRASTLSAISAVLGSLEIQNSGDGEILITSMGADSNKQLRINEDGIYSSTNGGISWSLIIGINNDGKISVGFDAYSQGEDISDIASKDISGTSNVATQTTGDAYEIWPFSDPRIDSTSYPSINWSTSSGDQVLISSSQTLEHPSQYAYFDTGDSYEISVAPSSKSSSLESGKIACKPFVMQSNGSVTYGGEVQKIIYSSPSDSSRADQWVTFGLGDMAISDVITVGNSFKVGVVFKTVPWNETIAGTFKGRVKIDAVGEGPTLIKT